MPASGGLHGIDDPHVEEGQHAERKQTSRNIIRILHSILQYHIREGFNNI